MLYCVAFKTRFSINFEEVVVPFYVPVILANLYRTLRTGFCSNAQLPIPQLLKRQRQNSVVKGWIRHVMFITVRLRNCGTSSTASRVHSPICSKSVASWC